MIRSLLTIFALLAAAAAIPVRARSHQDIAATSATERAAPAPAGAPPAALRPYIVDGVFAPGDYQWMRGRFADAAPADKAAYAAVQAWTTQCTALGTQRARAALRELGVEAAKLPSDTYGEALCDNVVMATPGVPTSSWSAFQRSLAAARPYIDSYLFAVSSSGSGQSLDPSLRARLLNRPIAEQMLRSAFGWGQGDAASAPPLPAGTRPLLFAALAYHTGLEDRANTRWLDSIMRESGWPGIAAVGEGASKMAWLIAQHADQDPAFQLRVLRAMEPMVKTKDVDPANYAYLYDRVMLKIVGTQRYGTQATCRSGQRVPETLDGSGDLDTLRASVGLEPEAKYMATMNSTFGACPKSN